MKCVVEVTRVENQEKKGQVLLGSCVASRLFFVRLYSPEQSRAQPTR